MKYKWNCAGLTRGIWRGPHIDANKSGAGK
jgi:hypothetical protein